MIKAVIFALVLTSSAGAMAQNSTGFNITATVPVICRVDGSLSPIPADGSHVFAGEFTEICNTDASYGLILHHRELQDGEEATITYNGKEIALGRTGFTLLGDARGPARKRHTIEAMGKNLTSPIGLHLVMQQH